MESFNPTYLGNPGYSWEFLVGVCRPVLPILALFQTKKCHFHTRFETWSLRNYVIITQIRTPNKTFLKPLRIRILLFLPYALGIETTNTFVHFRSSFIEKLYSILDQNGQNVYPFLDRNGTIPILFGPTHTNMAYVREVLPHMVKTKMIS